MELKVKGSKPKSPPPTAPSLRATSKEKGAEAPSPSPARLSPARGMLQADSAKRPAPSPAPRRPADSAQLQAPPPRKKKEGISPLHLSRSLVYHVEASFEQPVPNLPDGFQIRTIDARLNPAKSHLKPDSVHISSPQRKSGAGFPSLPTTS